LQGREDRAGQGSGIRVKLDVELAELAGPRRIIDRRQDVGVGHRGVAEAIDEIELYFQADPARSGVEARLLQHTLEHVKARAYFVTVCPPVLTGDRDRRYFPAHPCPPCAASPLAPATH